MRDTQVRKSKLRLQRVVGRGAPQDLPTLRDDVIAIFGPTASGKSAVAADLAARLGTEVVSADALQVYRGLEILTNQPHDPTRLVAIRDLSSPMSVGEYATLAHDAVDQLVSQHGAAVVAGGTGLYFRAALADLQIPQSVGPSARACWETVYDADPLAAHAHLVEMDPEAAASVHANDRRRVVRALELAEAGASLAPPDAKLWSEHTRRPTLIVGLVISPRELELRIARRADEMFRRGVVEEVRAAVGGPMSMTARKALGLEDVATLPASEARERLVQRTRRYAAYQRKWMARIPGLVPIDGERPTEDVTDAILDVARAR